MQIHFCKGKIRQKKARNVGFRIVFLMTASLSATARVATMTEDNTSAILAGLFLIYSALQK